ncbi:MAG: hypothetical protein ACRDJG_10555, partial [Actinomycetota bacterium]
MKLPKPVSPGPGQASQAPYNFVPLADSVYEPEDPLPGHGEYSKGHLSGQIEISLRTETWLYTRAGIPPSQASNDDLRAFKPSSPYPEFFHHGDPRSPVVPGSSLRGMLRQLIEVLSDGRLDMASTEPIVYRAVGDTTRFGWFYRRRFVGPNRWPGQPADSTRLPQELDYPIGAVRGGYLFTRGRAWFIRPAKEHHGSSFVRFADRRGRRVHPNFPAPGKHYPVWVEPRPVTTHFHGNGRLKLRDPRTDKVPRRRSEPCPPGWTPGNLVVTDGLGNKHMHLV